MNIGDKIKEQRLKRQWTQEHLATLLNVSRPTVSSWEVGRNYPDLVTLVAISDLFDISLDKLLKEDQQMTKKVSKKIRMNKVYKILLVGFSIIFILYFGYNRKLSMDEAKYRKNLVHYGWKIDTKNYTAENNGYELIEKNTSYWTNILPTGLIGFPLSEQEPTITSRRESLVIRVGAKKESELVIAKDNDPSILFSGTVLVNEHAEVSHMDSSWSKEKKDFMKHYIKNNQREYVSLISETREKRNEIVSKK